MFEDFRSALTGASRELIPTQPNSLRLVGVSTHAGTLPGQQQDTRTWRRWIVLLSFALAAAILATFLTGPIHQSFAATSASENCSTRPIAAWCNGQDPIDSGCASDAQTVGQSLIVDDANNVFGRLEIRYSKTCNSYWGRAFSYLPHLRLAIDVRDLGYTNPQGSYEGAAPEVYSNMFFGSRPGIGVQVIGTNDRTNPSVYIPGVHG